MRQILCYWCSVRVFVDEAPSGSFPPPHCCLACRGSWPPTEAEEKFRRAREHDWSTRQRERKGRRKPILGVIGKKLSKVAVHNLRIQERQDEILSKPLGQLTRAEKEWLIRLIGSSIAGLLAGPGKINTMSGLLRSREQTCWE